MKEETQNYEQQDRQGYVPASVKVIEVTVQRVICQSPSPGFGDYGDGGNI